MLAPWKKSYDQILQHIKKERHYFTNKDPFSQSYGFSSSHVWMWKLDYKASWDSKNWCFWTVVLEKTLESPLDSKEIQSVSTKGNQSWIELNLKLQYFGLLMWRIHLKRPLCRERLKAGGERDDRGWDHWMASPTQWTWVCVNSGSLACCTPRGRKESDVTEWLNWTELRNIFKVSGPSLPRNVWGKVVCRLFWVSALILNSVWPWACCHLVRDIAPKNTGLEDLAQLYIFLIPIVREKMVVTVSMFCNHFKVCKI